MSVEISHNFSATPTNKDSHPAEAQHKIPNTDSDISPDNSEIETLLRRSGRLRYAEQRHGNIAQPLAMSIAAQEVIHEPFIYNQALQSPEVVRWQKAMHEKYNTLVANQTWDVVDTQEGHRVLQDKWVYKLKMSNEGTVSRYKARWVAKGFEQRERIDYEETFFLVVKSCSTRILFTLAAFYNWFIEHLDAVTAYLNSNLDVLLYVELLNGYLEAGKVALLRKTIYGLKQSARQWNKNLSITKNLHR